MRLRRAATHPSSIVLENFERIEATPETALLRIAGHVSGHGSLEPPALLIGESRPRRLVPLPAPPNPPGVLRAAYRAPRTVLEGESAFALELGEGVVVDLPSPRLARLRREPPPGPTLDEKRVTGLERELQSERDQRLRVEQRADELGSEVGGLHAELRDTQLHLGEAHDDVAATAGNLERVKAQLEQRLGEEASERQAVQGELETLRDELRSAHAREEQQSAAQSEAEQQSAQLQAEALSEVTQTREDRRAAEERAKVQVERTKAELQATRAQESNAQAEVEQMHAELVHARLALERIQADAKAAPREEETQQEARVDQIDAVASDRGGP